MATKPKNEIETAEQEMTAEQALAQKEKEMLERVAEKEKAAEEKMAKAEQALENAKLAAASIVTEPQKTFSQEVNEMAKLSMKKRMERQFGTPEQTPWKNGMTIPFDQYGAESVLTVTVNGIGYDFARGEMYDMPEALWDVVLRSRYVESPLAKKARTGQLVTNM